MVWLCKNGVKKQIFNWEGEKNVGAQCDWYCFDHVNQQLTGRLIEQPMFAHGFYCCIKYICSLPPPVINYESQLLFSSDITVMEMKKKFNKKILSLPCLLHKFKKNQKNILKILKNHENLKKIEQILRKSKNAPKNPKNRKKI